MTIRGTTLANNTALCYSWTMRNHTTYKIGRWICTAFLVAGLWAGSWVSAAEIMERLDFSLLNLEGEKVTLSEQVGKPIALVFWATYCPTCREEIPDMRRFYEKYKNTELVFLSVAIDRKTAEEVKEFTRRFSISYPVLLGDSSVARKWGVKAIPAAFIIDRTGNVIHRFTGLHVTVDLDRRLKNILAP